MGCRSEGQRRPKPPMCACNADPTLQEGWKTIEGKPIKPGLHAAVEAMVAQMNAGIALLKPLQAR